MPTTHKTEEPVLVAPSKEEEGAQCRLYRTGDTVQETVVNGRRYGMPYRINRLHEVAVVLKDESQDNKVYVQYRDNTQDIIDAAYLKLIRPVEERKLYYVHESVSDCSFEICREEGDRPVCRMAYFWYSYSCRGELDREEARELAERECQRLNNDLLKQCCHE
jgi:hypothetical protein